MLDKKLLTLFENYANEYNKDPESEASDTTFELLAERTFELFTPEENERVINILCTITNDNKIPVNENLIELKDFISVMEEIESN
jgi:hypothetical protein